ncbi:RPAP1-like protein [Tricladium varicosporioides]|nr:RPAP1-like protein [Hymenoscyphus varicosporioides]
MNLRGQRFTVDLSDEEDEHASPSRVSTHAIPSVSNAFIGDIQERQTAPPTAPKLSNPTGFPQHKKRTRVSAFKQQRAKDAKAPAADTGNAFGMTTPKPSFSPQSTNAEYPSEDVNERRRIDVENNQRLAAMSAEEIAEEREELMAQLDPSLIERLLKRANLDQGRGDTGIEPPKISEVKENPEEVAEELKHGVPAPKPLGKPVAAQKTVKFEDDSEPAETVGLQRASEIPDKSNIEVPSIHFPQPQDLPDLDPSDPSFLENLHSKYYPNLPADPSKLAWMAPLPTHGSIADQESPYYPNKETMSASALRFDFRGGLLPPRISRAVPSTKGLHHHGEAPEAAGYTVPELARLARSAFPAQRCIAFQTLGRLLYRLGRGEWGDEDGEITKGLWRCVEEGKIVQTLEEAASAEGGHQGSKMYATEAAWLWQKGGGKRWKAN